jgi:hypothetical protein
LAFLAGYFAQGTGAIGGVYGAYPACFHFRAEKTIVPFHLVKILPQFGIIGNDPGINCLIIHDKITQCTEGIFPVLGII